MNQFFILFQMIIDTISLLGTTNLWIKTYSYANLNVIEACK